jgi:hypothetical protein
MRGMSRLITQGYSLYLLGPRSFLGTCEEPKPFATHISRLLWLFRDRRKKRSPGLLKKEKKTFQPAPYFSFFIHPAVFNLVIEKDP